MLGGTGKFSGFQAFRLSGLPGANTRCMKKPPNGWADDFDPARFDLDLANRRLAQAFKPAPKRPRKPRKKP